MPPHVITINQRVGRCRWCQCTELEQCEGGCGWANRDQTLCTACVALDRALRTIDGRRELAEFVHDRGFLVGA